MNVNNEYNKDKVLCIIQARMSSTRLPGKVLKEVKGKPLLAYMIERIMPSKEVNKMIVATSQDSSDNPIVDWCTENHVEFFRGSLNDVLDRFYQCAISLNPIPDIIVRLTADCPLHHYMVVDFAIDYFLSNRFDYFTNSFEPYYEDGFDVEVFTLDALRKAWESATRQAEREHVTLWIRNNSMFRRGFRKYRDEYRFKLSVDSQNDFLLVKKILEDLYDLNHFFTIDDVISLLKEHPEYLEINKESIINEGLEIS
ncbi:MAG: glycosyltransferase family protein [Palaeococcus sp.]|uniref:glycosyltransferase family protein n=1 Tax=Palaeococcus sp. (in: euryarchaeotes) TaxID=2820298 RepID=UPI0025F1F6C9|nr:glycosyltransferase family protein [Palaeococcus sp. (in: euryarchaeotes)]MCD6558920.1 glycosyltransferase family protein [Palaeococcus sp. (in: euryarchaeotes)]